MIKHYKQYCRHDRRLRQGTQGRKYGGQGLHVPQVAVADISDVSVLTQTSTEHEILPESTYPGGAKEENRLEQEPWQRRQSDKLALL